MRIRLLMRVLLWLLLAVPAAAQAPVEYHVSFPAPEHRWAQVEVTFRDVPEGPLEARMSRSSPGRYALHEFAKNVFDVEAFDGAGRRLTPTRPDPHQWTVAGHDGTVRIRYKVYGDHVDGTYLGIDTTHAHMNIPPTLLWARGLDGRAARVTFAPPEGSDWRVATQLFPTAEPWTFTAPNLQYLMDSPTELSAHSVRAFEVSNPDGRTFTIRAAVHHDAREEDIDLFIADVERIVREMVTVFGEYPEFETGAYTFIADYLPWVAGDGMEHRNSTILTAPVSLRDARQRRAVLGTVAHEFFHAWNVERIRPADLEPFDFERANMSSLLWLAEGFTSYYGPLVMIRAGLLPLDQALGGLSGWVDAVANGPGRRFRSPVEMSQFAPFTDAARAVDRTNFGNTFISYYTYGAAIGLALDLELRVGSGGARSLDDYMRALWLAHGKPDGPEPGLVARPYTLDDARSLLADMAGDPAFAREFFARYIEGREAPHFARLLDRAGIVVRRRNPGTAWLGAEVDAGGRITALVPWGSPAYEAGLQQDHVITAVDGRPLPPGGLPELLRGRKPGDRITVAFTTRGGPASTVVTLGEDPSLVAVTIESTGATLTPEQQTFREAWLGSKR